MTRLLAFVLVPLVEMAVLIWVGGRIGIGWTLAVVIVTGLVGAMLVKHQGLAVWFAARERMGHGELPTVELAHGAMLLVSGAFLLTPGFLTDVVGFGLLIPVVREQIRLRIAQRISQRVGAVRVDVWR
jgi:UPF0716 protein FxsA